MKKFLVLLAALAAPAAASYAQVPVAPAQTAPAPAVGQQNSPDQMVQRRAQYLAKELALTADQQAKLTPILLAQREQLQTLREQRTTGGRRQGTAQDLRAAQTRFDDQIRAVLTPEQFTKFDQLRNEQREKMREHRANNQAAPPTE